jgi:hypothetical protein
MGEGTFGRAQVSLKFFGTFFERKRERNLNKQVRERGGELCGGFFSMCIFLFVLFFMIPHKFLGVFCTNVGWCDSHCEYEYEYEYEWEWEYRIYYLDSHEKETLEKGNIRFSLSPGPGPGPGPSELRQEDKS